MDNFIVRTWRKFLYGDNFISRFNKRCWCRKQARKMSDDELWDNFKILQDRLSVWYDEHSRSRFLYEAICKEVARRAKKSDKEVDDD